MAHVQKAEKTMRESFRGFIRLQKGVLEESPSHINAMFRKARELMREEAESNNFLSLKNSTALEPSQASVMQLSELPVYSP